MLVAALLGVGASIVVPLVTKTVVDGPVAHGQRDRLVPLALLALALGMTEGVLIFIRRWIQTTATLGMEKRMRDDIYAHLQSLPPAFHDRWQSGQLLSRATADLSAVRRFVGFGLVFLVVNVATFATVIALLVRLDPLLGGIVALSLIPVIVVCARFERGYSVVSRRVQDQTGDLATSIEESATGIRVIKAFGRRRLMAEAFETGAREVYDTQLAKVRLRATFWALLDLVPNATLGIVLLLGALAVGQHRLTLGGLVAFITLVLQLIWPVEALGFILASGQEAATAAQRIYEVLDSRPEIVDRPDARVVDDSPGCLRFEAAGFTYPGGRRPVLQDINLTIAPGETVALVGATGSGKTTMAGLVPRLTDVTAGRITLDGVDIRDLRLTSLRRLVATAFEEPILFSASVRENVTLGTPDATDADIAAALSLAQAAFVDELPWGLDTRIGEQGLSLSGGQRQRLALARAVIGRPRVLILDDPLSALDVTTESLVEKALARVLADSTALLVVHRPSTIALADRVALLQGGTLAAIGTHSELMADVPAYRAILSQESEEVQSR
ncbi:MAG: ABC transporter [Pseudonocardiales bacterium]|nr:MAG: ABC transporter [Pseudonocardiales bacterium]